MNKTLILNSTWLAVAAAAFVFGRSSVGNSGEDSSAASQRGKSSSASGRMASTPSGGSANTRGASSAKNGRAGNGRERGSGVTVAKYLQETDSLIANKMFADLLLELTADNAADVFAQLKESRLEGQKMGLFLEAWGKLDGAAAMEAMVASESDGRRRSFGAMSILTGWAAVDPAGARAHVDAAENGWEKSMLMQGLVTGLARTDPAAATDYVLQVDAAQRAQAENGEGGRGDDRFRGFSVDRQMDSIANVLMRRGMGEATTWAEGLPDGSVKSSAFDRIAESYARDDPAAAAAWVLNHADNEYAGRAVREVAEELARKDPAAAASWAENLPEASQAGAMRETMERWTREDPAAAGDYLTAMPQSAARDSAVSSFARELDREEPQIAAQWAGSIANEEMRAETLESVARSWMRSNAEQATEWLPASGLSAEAQQKVITDAQRDAQRGDGGGGRDWRGGGGGRGR